MKMDLISLDKKVCLSVPKLKSINLLERLVVLFMEKRKKKINISFRYCNNNIDPIYHNGTLMVYIKRSFLKYWETT